MTSVFDVTRFISVRITVKYLHFALMSWSKGFFLMIFTPVEPIITKPDGSTPSPLELSLGETLSLTCEAKGNPAPNVTWKKNRIGEIIGTSQLNINRLVLKLEKDEDFGIYMCIARNRLNTASLPVLVKKG